MSDKVRTEAERLARNKAIHQKGLETLKRLKRQEYLERRDPLPSSDDPWANIGYVTWRGQKFKVEKLQWRGEDVTPDSHQKKTKTTWGGEDV